MGRQEEAEALSAYVTRLKRLTTEDLDTVVERVCGFARNRAVILAIQASVDAMKEGERTGQPPDVDFPRLFEEALNVGQDLDDDGLLLHRDADATLDALARPDYGVRTGFHQWDGIWRRGWCPGWLITLLAPPKCFKTGTSINLALSMISPAVGQDVFYYACEIDQKLAALRCFTHLTGQPEEALFEDEAGFRRLMHRRIQRRVAANFLIKDYPSKSASIATIEAHAKRTMRRYGFKPKAIVVDYAETVAVDKAPSRASEHEQKASVYTQARAMASRLGCCVIMPDRCNKETVSMRVPNMTSFQGAFQKAGIVDVAIGLCATEQERLQNVLRTFVFLNRHGEAYQHFKGKMDGSTMRLDLGEPVPYDADDADEAAQEVNSNGGFRQKARVKQEKWEKHDASLS